MIELVATLVIMVSSMGLFAYWFRYTCLLILTAKTTRDYGFQVATDYGLNYARVQTELRQETDLDRLYDLLDRDYAVVTRLIKASNSSIDLGIEGRMLAINYRLTGLRYRMALRFSAHAAREALEEMSATVAHFANSIGEAAASPSAA